MWGNSQFPAHLVTFTEEIFNGKLYFLCSVYSRGTCKTSTRKNFGPAKIPTRKNMDPRNTNEKKFGPTKYPRKKISDPWRHGGLMARGLTRTTMLRDPQNLAHSIRRRESWKSLKIIKLYTDKIFSALYLPS